MRRIVRLFKPRFAELVRSGAKRQTVRPMPKRMPRVGDLLDARMWLDLPYRSKQARLIEGRVRRVSLIEVGECGITLDAVDLTLESGNEFARKDGFSSEADMVCWFREQHGLPFAGIVIYWEPLP